MLGAPVSDPMKTHQSIFTIEKMRFLTPYMLALSVLFVFHNLPFAEFSLVPTYFPVSLT